ncbi:MAG: GNAT family N-acetyltransferase, partial [bacterium]
LAIIRKSDGLLLGRVGLATWLIPDETELGYGLARDAWGQGYASEAAIALRDWAFVHLPVPRLISIIADPNVRSQGVARRNGFLPAEHRNWYGQPTTIWAMTREQWAASTMGV